MIRSSQIRTLSAVAFAILLPVAAFAAQGTTAAKSDAATKSKTHMAAHTKRMPAVDINSASKEDLMKLNGITDETAEKIIAGRPYKSKAELAKKSILTKAEYAKVRTHIIAKQGTAMGESKAEESKESPATEAKENKTETGK
jgi:DNA uptake protein ComE-like DNA-binding protein